MGCCFSSTARQASLRQPCAATAAPQQPAQLTSPSAAAPGGARRCCRAALLPGLDAREACALLHVAAAAGHDDCLHELLSMPGVWPDSPDTSASQSGQTSLMRAAAAAPPRPPSGQAAAQHAPGSLVQQLLEAGASVKRSDHRGWQALHHAAAAGHEAAIEKLVAAGADPMGRTLDRRQTAYELAAAGGHHGAAQLLLKLCRQRQRGTGGSAQDTGSARVCGPPLPAEAAAIAAEMRAAEAEAALARSRQHASPAGLRRRQARSKSADGVPASTRQGAGLAAPVSAETRLAEVHAAAAQVAEAQVAAALAGIDGTAQVHSTGPAPRSRQVVRSKSLDGVPAQAQGSELAAPAAAETRLAEVQAAAARAAEARTAALLDFIKKTARAPSRRSAGRSRSFDGTAAGRGSAPALSSAARAFLLHPVAGDSGDSSSNDADCSHGSAGRRHSAAQPAGGKATMLPGAAANAGALTSSGRGLRECAICLDSVGELLALFPWWPSLRLRGLQRKAAGRPPALSHLPRPGHRQRSHL
ncbi:hypothetical protein ABPG75_010926 [Micractinium tetrahymenae]